MQGGLPALVPPGVDEGPAFEEQLRHRCVPTAAGGMQRGMGAVALQALDVCACIKQQYCDRKVATPAGHVERGDDAGKVELLRAGLLPTNLLEVESVNKLVDLYMYEYVCMLCMYVCMYVCMYCYVCMYVCIIRMYVSYVYTYAYTRYVLTYYTHIQVLTYYTHIQVNDATGSQEVNIAHWIMMLRNLHASIASIRATQNADLLGITGLYTTS